MTAISAVMVRDRTPAMFDDLLVAYPGATYTATRTNGVTTLDFCAELDPATVAAIRDRMTSRDDPDQVTRAALRADRDALAADSPLRRLYNYLLGDT